jgi:hypothetical protein
VSHSSGPHRGIRVAIIATELYRDRFRGKLCGGLTRVDLATRDGAGRGWSAALDKPENCVS